MALKWSNVQSVVKTLFEILPLDQFFSLHHIDACACGKPDAAFHEKLQIHWLFLPEILQYCNFPLTQPLANVFRNMQLVSVLVRLHAACCQTFREQKYESLWDFVWNKLSPSVNSVLQTNVRDHRYQHLFAFQFVHLPYSQLFASSSLEGVLHAWPHWPSHMSNRSLHDHFFHSWQEFVVCTWSLGKLFLLGKNQIV